MKEIISNLFKNWKTTSAGLMMCTGAILKVVYAIKHNDINEQIWLTAFGAFFGGIGLISAGDAAISRQQVQESQQRTATAIETSDTTELRKPVDGTKPPAGD